MIIGGGEVSFKPNVYCQGCGLAVKTEAQAQMKKGRLCADCVADALGQLIKSAGIDPADTTLLDFMVKFGHGEMPEETSLQTFLDYLLAKVKKTIPAQNAPPSPAEVKASWNGIVPLAPHEKGPFDALYQDISGEKLVRPMNLNENRLCQYYNAVLLEGDRIAMNMMSSQTLEAFVSRLGKKLTPIRAHQRQIDEALRILGVKD